MRFILIAALVLIGVAVNSCGGGACGLGLKQRFLFPEGGTSIGLVPCCGASVYKDLNLTADNVQVDLINSSGAAERVDEFLADGNCTKLFAGSYAGMATSPLCTIYVGPVTAGVTSPRKSIRAGHYRVFAQAYTANDAPGQFLMEVGLWSEACRWTPVDP